MGKGKKLKSQRPKIRKIQKRIKSHHTLSHHTHTHHTHCNHTRNHTRKIGKILITRRDHTRKIGKIRITRREKVTIMEISPRKKILLNKMQCHMKTMRKI